MQAGASYDAALLCHVESWMHEVGRHVPTRYRVPVLIHEMSLVVRRGGGHGLWTQTPYTHNHS